MTALLFGLLLGLGVVLGSVAHATEGPQPVEASCLVAEHQSEDGSPLREDGKSLPHVHSCHGHHVAVPGAGIPAPAEPKMERSLASVSTPALGSTRIRTPLEPPRA